MIGVQDEDSCGKSEAVETPQANSRGGSTLARGKRSPARKSTAALRSTNRYLRNYQRIELNNMIN
nr:hypothetical protein [Bacillus sp. Marseille-Q1617]